MCKFARRKENIAHETYRHDPIHVLRGGRQDPLITL